MNTIYTVFHRGFRIMANTTLGYNAKLMDKIIWQFCHIIQKHNKVYFIRFDLHFPSSSEISAYNSHITRLMDSLKTNLSRKGADPHLFWVREQDISDHHHYHCYALLDGNKINNQFSTIETVKRLWGLTMNTDPAGLVNYNRQGGIMLRSDDPQYQEKLNHCIYLASYLTKNNTKGKAPFRAREFGYTHFSE